MSKILITGSGGFVGKNLKEYLKEDYNLLTPRSFELNISDKTAVEKYFEANNIDFVIHCATKGGARGITDDISVIDENLKMFNNLLICSGKNRIITFGSGAEYDKSRPLAKIREENLGEIIPKDPYGMSKYLMAKEVEKLDNALCLNIFGAYGRWEKETRFPTYAISQNLKKEPIIINKDVVFDYLYIDDLCKIVKYFVESKPNEKIMNITPTQSISLSEISQIINEISGFKSEIIIKENGLNAEYTGDNSRLLNELGGFCFTSYEKGLKNLFDFLGSVDTYSGETSP
ncbi:MAG: NAD-dependent epimerase/dehydratase family protein [Candidatus Gastranaerophilaceae bacterium]